MLCFFNHMLLFLFTVCVKILPIKEILRNNMVIAVVMNIPIFPAFFIKAVLMKVGIPFCLFVGCRFVNDVLQN